MTTSPAVGIRTVVPMLAYEDAAAAIDWLERAFGFSEQADMR